MKKGRRVLKTLLICILMGAMVLCGKMVRDDVVKQSAESVEKAVWRAAHQCYALEGVYPPALEVLERDYGLMLDHERFIVFYECYASNHPPQIEVFAR